MGYVPHTPDEIRHMLDRIGVSSTDALFETIPESLRSKAGLDVGEPLAERTLIAHRMEDNPELPPTWAVLKGKWKLIVERGRVELYNTRRDPQEHEDLASRYPAVRTELENVLAAYQLRVRSLGNETVEIGLDAEILEALEDLGYVR